MCLLGTLLAQLPEVLFSLSSLHGCLCNQASVLAVLLAVPEQLHRCLAPCCLVLDLLPGSEGCFSLYHIPTCNPELFILLQALAHPKM